VNTLVTSRARRVALPLLLVVNLMTPLAAGPSGASPAAAPLPLRAPGVQAPAATGGFPSDMAAGRGGPGVIAASRGSSPPFASETRPFGRGRARWTWPRPAPAAPALPRAVSVTPVTPVTGTAPLSGQVAAAYGRLPLSFEPNRGQTDSRASFLARGPSYALYLTGADAVLVLADARSLLSAHRTHIVGGVVSVDGALTQTAPITYAALRLSYVGANPLTQPAGEAPLPGAVNYLTGGAPAAWKTGVPTYGRVAYRGLYPGIDLAYHGEQGRLEYDWTVAPTATVGAIAFSVEGARAVSLDGAGNLRLDTAVGPARLDAPVAYQTIGGQRHAVQANYALTGATRVGVVVGAYDHSQPLVIDPVLAYSTYLGGNANGLGIAVDGAGDAYVTGQTSPGPFPVTTGAYSTTNAGGDVFVTKFNPAGNALVYSTYLGGASPSSSTGGKAIAVDAAGEATIAGYTGAADYPTKNAAQARCGSCATGYLHSGFVTRLSAAGNALVYSTFLGGEGGDTASGLALDPAGNAYVAGDTNSFTFPIKNALFPANNAPADTGAGDDGFVTKLDGGGALVYSTFLGGGAGQSIATGIAVDAAGDAYVSGHTGASDFPVKNAYQPVKRGSHDTAFVTVLNPSDSALVYSTYLGGSGTDVAAAIALDGSGDAYVTGQTTSRDFPLRNAAQPTYPGGSTSGFVAALTAAGNALIYSTYYGGAGTTGYDGGGAIAVDAASDAYVAGTTSATATLPIVGGAFQPAYGGGGDGTVARFAAGGALTYSSYLGGSGFEEANGIAVDGAGVAYVTGATASPNFPVATPYSGTPPSGGYTSAFVAKIAQPSGAIPWHPHQNLAVGGDASVSVDLADGHADVTTSDMSIPARGLGLALNRTWDSASAASGASPTGGWTSSLTPRMGGLLTGTVLYTDTSGAVWAFPYQGSPTDAPPYTNYAVTPGKPWQLSTSSSGYALTNFLSDEVMTFDASGRLTTDQDSYGNTNTMSYGSGSAASPAQEANSGGRTLTFSYQNGLLSDAQSPLWQSSGGTQGQHVTYAYSGGQLTGITRGAGTPDAVTTMFGYSGTRLVTITSPQGEAFTLGYNAAGQVTSLTSPATGTPGQAGYTPSYTTTISYLPGATRVVQGSGTTAALTTAYTLDGQGEATSVVDGLGHTTSSTYDADHDVLTSTDANNNTTTNSYAYVGSTGSIGLLTRTSSPPVASDTLGATPAPLVTVYSYGLGYDLTETDLPNGGVTLNTYDGHHGLYSSARLVSGGGGNAVWRGAITVRDGYGEPAVVLDPRGVQVGLNGAPVQFGPQSSSYQSRSTYDPQGDLQTSATPPITTTTAGVTTTAPVITSYGYDGDGNQISMTTPNGNKTTYVYDGLGRQVQTMMPPVPVVPAGSGGIGPHLRLGQRPATAVAWQRTDTAVSERRSATVGAWQTTGRPRSNGPATAVAWQQTDTAVSERWPAAVGRPRSAVGRGVAQRRAGLSTANRQRAMTPTRMVARHSDGIVPDTTTVIVGRPTPPTVTIPTVTIPAPGQTTTPASTTTLASPTISMPAITPASPMISASTAPAAVSATASVSATTSTVATTPTDAPTPVATTLPGDIATSTPVTALIALPPAASATPPVAAGLITGTTALTNATAGLGAGQLASYGRLPLSFEANRGQTDGRVRYLARGAGYGLYLTGTDAVLALTVPTTPTVSRAARDALDAGTGLLTPTAPLSETAVRLRYVGASAGPALEGQQRLPGDANYLMGSDPSGWHTGIPTYARIVYHDVYPGIDLAYHGTQGRLEYDWTVAPGASVSALTLAVDGARGLSQDAHGALSLRTAAGVVRLYAPSTYQTIGGQRRAVASRYVLTGGTRIGVAVGAYDAARPLVIDPVLGYSTYLGGSSGNSAGNGIAVDGAGSAYVVGSTTSPNFPQQNAYNGGVFTNAGNEVFVTKLAPDGQSLAYSTYLGGNGDTQGLAIAVNGAGNAYLTGFTWANNYPLTPGAYQTMPGGVGRNDVFVTELGATGNSLVYSTYLGGEAYDSGQAIALDGQGHVYVTGNTVYDNAYGAFPTTPGAFQTTFSSRSAQDPRNAFLAELDPSTSGAAGLLYSTFLGGDGLDEGHGVVVSNGAVWVAGWTTSHGANGGPSFPTTANAYQPAFGSGTTDAFVAALKPSNAATDGAGYLPPARQLVYSTLLGSGADNRAAAVTADASGSVYVTGASTGGFPTTPDAYQPGYAGGGSDAFVARLSMDGGLAYGTYLGGSRGADQGTGIAVDGSSNVYVTGFTSARDFPITGAAFQTTYRGQSDAFVAEFGAGLTGAASLLYGSLLGGGNADQANALALDSVGNAYVTGQTTSTDFTTLTPYSATNVAGGAYDSFVTKVGTALVRGTIGTVAGVGGANGYNGDGGRATAAQLSHPVGEPALDGAGDLFFSDTSNRRVREVLAASGAIVTVVDSTGAGGFGGDGGPASAAQVSAPEGVALDAAGDLYIADAYNNRVREVRATGGVVGPTSTIVTVAGTGAAGSGGDGGLATQAQLNNPVSLAVDRAGNLYIADYYNNRVREVRAVGGSVGPTSTIVTVAGGGSPPSGVGDGGAAVQASLYDPSGVALDGAGNLYIADRFHARIREVLATGGSIGATSAITTVAGTGSAGYNGDGIPAVSASLVEPTGVAVDAAGNLYIADYNNGRVRVVLATGGSIGATSAITTVAGTGVRGYNGDNSAAATTQLTNPWGVATDAAGNLYIVDTYGQRVREVGGVGPVSVATTTMAPTSSTRYDGDGHAISQTDANGHTATTAYDPLGRAVLQTNPVSGTTIMTYTATELTQQRDAQGNVTAYAYDGAGRRTLTTEPVTGTVQYQYDAVGNTVAITNADTAGTPLSVETRLYDALNRVTADSVTGPGSPPTTLTTLTAYTRDGQTAVTKQPNTDTTTTAYDLADEALSTTLLSNGTTTTEATYSYDGAGNATTTTDADGRTITAVYDPSNRLSQSVATGGGTTTVTTAMAYDPDGNTVAETAQTTDSAHPGQVQVATHAATYDAGDRQATTTDNGLTTVYGYDAAGQQRVATVQDGQTALSTTRDAEGRVTSISEGAGNAGPYTSSFSYNANGQPQAFALPGGIQEIAQFNPNSEVTGVTAQGPSTGGTFTSLTSQYTYTYDAANRVNSTRTLSGTDSLAYDGASRIISETEQAGSMQVIAKGGAYGWTYDGNGNIQTAIDDSGATDVYTYSTSIKNELMLMGATDAPLTKTTAYTYDNHGDVTSIANTATPTDKNALSQHLTYDGFGRPIQVTYLDHGNGNTTTTITIGYNADGQRSDYTYTPRGQPTLDTQFQYRNGELAEQRVISDTATGPVVIYTNTYLYGPNGEPLELLHAQPGQTVARYWYILDGQGSVVALTDANGSVVDRYAYDNWGESTSDDRTNEHVPQQLRYDGYYYDEKLSWYWLPARYYDPETERFLQPDPSEQDGVHTYVYVSDAPNDAIDPTGLAVDYSTPPSWTASCTNRGRTPIVPCKLGGNEPLNVIISAQSTVPVEKNYDVLGSIFSKVSLFDSLGYTNCGTPTAGGPSPLYANVDGHWKTQDFGYRDEGCAENVTGGNHVRGWKQNNGNSTAWFLALSEEHLCQKQESTQLFNAWHCINAPSSPKADDGGFDQGRADFVSQVLDDAAFSSSVKYIHVPSLKSSKGSTDNVPYDDRVAILTIQYSNP